MTRLQEIEARMATLKTQMEAPEADLDAIEREVDALSEERAKLIGENEKRNRVLGKIAQRGVDETVMDKYKMDEKPAERSAEEILKSAEYRSAFFNTLRGVELTPAEKRAFQAVNEKRAFSSSSSSAGAVIPTETANEIIRKLKERAPLLGEITLLNVAGNVTFAVEDTITAADKHTENAAITAAADKLVPVTLTGYEITKLIQVSKTVSTMSISAFETWVVDMLTECVGDKITAYIIGGTGSTQPTGIEKAATWGAGNSVTIGATANITYADVCNLIALLPGGYDRNAKFVMSKKTLWGDMMKLRDDGKYPIVKKDESTGGWNIMGYPVLLDENVAAHEAYLGDMKKMVANLAETITVVSDFDIDTNSMKYLGCAIFDCKPAVGEAFVKLTKAAAAG